PEVAAATGVGLQYHSAIRGRKSLRQGAGPERRPFARRGVQENSPRRFNLVAFHLRKIMEVGKLEVQLRSKHGKGPARRLRAQGLVPGVVYGEKLQEPLALVVDPKALQKSLD